MLLSQKFKSITLLSDEDLNDYSFNSSLERQLRAFCDETSKTLNVIFDLEDRTQHLNDLLIVPISCGRCGFYTDRTSSDKTMIAPSSDMLPSYIPYIFSIIDKIASDSSDILFVFLYGSSIINRDIDERDLILVYQGDSYVFKEIHHPENWDMHTSSFVVDQNCEIIADKIKSKSFNEWLQSNIQTNSEELLPTRKNLFTKRLLLLLRD